MVCRFCIDGVIADMVTLVFHRRVFEVLSKNSMVQQASRRCNYKVGGDRTMKDVVNNIDLLDVDLELYKIEKKNQQPNVLRCRFRVGSIIGSRLRGVSQQT